MLCATRRRQWIESLGSYIPWGQWSCPHTPQCNSADSGPLDFHRFKSRQQSPLDIYVVNKHTNVSSDGGHSSGCSFMGDIKIMILRWPVVTDDIKLLRKQGFAFLGWVQLWVTICMFGISTPLEQRCPSTAGMAGLEYVCCSRVRWMSAVLPVKWCGTCSCVCPGIYFPQDSTVYTSWLICEPWKHFEKVKQTVHWRIICHK